MIFYVVDGHSLLRKAIGVTLQKLRPSAKVIELEKFSDLTAASKRNGEPSLFVIDLLFADVRSTSAIANIRSTFPKVPLAVMSSLLNNDVKETCMKAGANSFIDKKASIPHIMQSLNALLTATSHAVNESSPVLKLSKRQRQIVMMLDIGMSNKSIANELNISQKTVNVHLWHLFRRIGVSSRTQAIRFARTNALL